jgi:hypothetical protein
MSNKSIKEARSSGLQFENNIVTKTIFIDTMKLIYNTSANKIGNFEKQKEIIY